MDLNVKCKAKQLLEKKIIKHRRKPLGHRSKQILDLISNTWFIKGKMNRLDFIN